MKKSVLAFLLFLIALPAFAAERESAYDLATKTQTIRCGYFLYAPMMVKDPNSGAFSGMFYDYVEALGQAMDVKIDWAQEGNFATYLADLNAGRYDMECSGGFPNALRGKQAAYSTPVAFIPTYLYARADDMRFDDKLEAVNDKAVRFAFIDGDTAGVIREQRFPKTTPVPLPQSVQPADTIMEILNGKADVAFLDVLTGDRLMAMHQGKIRQVKSQYLRAIPLNLSLPIDDPAFGSMINTAHQQLLYDGVIDRILDKYDPDKRLLVPVSRHLEKRE